MQMYLNTRDEGFGDEVKRRIMLGTYALSAGYFDAYYGKAQALRSLITKEFNDAFAGVDVIATPTTTGGAFKLGAKQDPLSMYMEDIFTVPANITGIPGISVPTGKDENNMPLGLQLLAPHFNDHRLFEVGKKIES